MEEIRDDVLENPKCSNNQPKSKQTSRISEKTLDALCTRFLIGIVSDTNYLELTPLLFQLENAHWFYLDNYVAENPQENPGISLKAFCYNMFRHCPWLKDRLTEFQTAFEEWRVFKGSVPTCGAILLDDTLKNCLLVQSMNGNSWGFPKGKQYRKEELTNCAIREVYEEIGYNIEEKLVEEEFFEVTIHEQRCRLYVIPHVPNETNFKPLTQGEIGDIRWFPVEDLPLQKKQEMDAELYPRGTNTFYMLIPFMRSLRAWIESRGVKLGKSRAKTCSNLLELGSSKSHKVPLKKKDIMKDGRNRSISMPLLPTPSLLPLPADVLAHEPQVSFHLEQDEEELAQILTQMDQKYKLQQQETQQQQQQSQQQKRQQQDSQQEQQKRHTQQQKPAQVQDQQVQTTSNLEKSNTNVPKIFEGKVSFSWTPDNSLIDNFEFGKEWTENLMREVFGNVASVPFPKLEDLGLKKLSDIDAWSDIDEETLAATPNFDWDDDGPWNVKQCWE